MSEEDFEAMGSLATEMTSEDVAEIESNVSFCPFVVLHSRHIIIIV